jgi:hypothetical protein
MSPSWKIGGCILNADTLPWQNKSLYCITNRAEIFIWNTNFHCPYTNGFFYILIIKWKNLLLASKFPAGMHASKVMKHITNVQDKNCVQVTSKSVPASKQFLIAVLKFQSV